MSDRVNAIEELNNSRPASSDPNSAAMQAWKAMIEKNNAKKQEAQLNNALQRNVMDTNRQVQELSNRQQQSSVNMSVNTAQANPLEGGMQVNFFDRPAGGAPAPAVTGAAGPTLAPTPTGIAPAAAPPNAPQRPQEPEERQQAQSQRQTATAAETVVTSQSTTTVNREEAVDEQVQSVQGGVSQTQYQSDGDDRVSIKEQDRTFEAKSAYTSTFGDNAGAKGAVTAAGQADSGYSGGDEQSNQGQQRQQ